MNRVPRSFTSLKGYGSRTRFLQTLPDRLLEISSALERAKLYDFDVGFRQTQPDRRIADRKVEQETTVQNLTVSFRLCMQETLYTLDRQIVYY